MRKNIPMLHNWFSEEFATRDGRVYCDLDTWGRSLAITNLHVDRQ